MGNDNLNASQEAGAAVPERPPKENLYRLTPDIGLTRSADGGMPTLTGHFAVWDQWTEIRSAYEGNFMERFASGAMTKTLAENTPKVLFQHGKDPQIGDKVLGPVSRVEPDSTGAFYEVPLLDTSYNRDLIPGLEAGLYGASFRFSVLQEDVVSKPKRSDENPRGIPERTVTEARVMEFGPVTFPAYAGATAGVRSITDEFLVAQLLEDDDIVGRLAEQIAAKSRFTVSFNGLGQDIATSSSSLTGSMTVLEAIQDAAAEEFPAEEAEHREDEPDPSGDTTRTDTEPEPPEATTHSTASRFWFAKDPTTKRSE